MVGYTTVYTMAPVFSLVLDEDVPVRLVFVYPELYRELQKARALALTTPPMLVEQSCMLVCLRCDCKDRMRFGVQEGSGGFCRTGSDSLTSLAHTHICVRMGSVNE